MEKREKEKGNRKKKKKNWVKGKKKKNENERKKDNQWTIVAHQVESDQWTAGYHFLIICDMRGEKSRRKSWKNVKREWQDVRATAARFVTSMNTYKEGKTGVEVNK